MTDDHGPQESKMDGTAAFEADMRQRRELMVQMADREHWEFDPVWVRAARIVGIAVIWIAGLAFVVWAVVVLMAGA